MSEAEAPTGPGPELKEVEKKKWQWEQECLDENRGYQMALDHGNLTLQEAWDELHGPCKQAKLQDKKWPYTTGHKKVLYCRTKLMELIKEWVTKNSETPAETIAALTMEYTKGKQPPTINQILNGLVKQQKSLMPSEWTFSFFLYCE